MYRISLTALLLTVFFSALNAAPSPSTADLPFSRKCKPVKNVIILIPDGCGTAHMTIARWFKGAPLAQDAMHAGLVNTFSANSAITGSAAAASAFATGYKTWEDDTRAGCLSLRPDSVVLPSPQKLPPDQAWRPVATLLEGARLSGRSTGIVANCNSNHATPAAFSSHWHERDSGNVITKQQVFENIDVVLAGGR
jgi:alkaline phosphatase